MGVLLVPGDKVGFLAGVIFGKSKITGFFTESSVQPGPTSPASSSRWSWSVRANVPFAA